MTYPNGDTFVGNFNDNKDKHGPATYTWSTQPGANPWVPEGEEDEEGEGGGGFPQDRIVKFEGSYHEGKKNGIGKITFPNGDKYHGMWENDKIHGEGTYYYISGDIYSGEWKEGKKHGEGAYVFGQDKSQLVGTFENGNIIKGKWVFKDGTSWHGSFKNNKPIGQGIFYFPNGNQQSGEYVEIGDPEDEEAELKLEWRGNPTQPSSTSTFELLKSKPMAN